MAQIEIPQTALFDLESDGLLPELTKIHVLAVRDYERRVTRVFRQNDQEDTIEQGLALLENAETVIGHNIVSFDIPALEKCYTDVNIKGRILDTLVMSRMLFTDQKDKDYRLKEDGKLEGKLIGQHSLKAWGQRLGYNKGDYLDVYMAKAKELGIEAPEKQMAFVWSVWNQDMEDYCVDGDITITTLLYEKILRKDWDQSATRLEHEIHDLMAQQERNGIFFNVEAAEKLAMDLQESAETLRAETIAHFGKWWRPEKKRITRPLWQDPEGINAGKTYVKTRPEFGEDGSRAIWAEVTVPKQRRVMVKGGLCPTIYDPEAAYCKIDWQEFNPGSRPQIIDRLTTVHSWHPVDFTETGQPEVSDNVLRALTSIPIAKPLAELFYYKKRIGQIATGPGAWLRKVTPEGKIHAYVNVGGTVSGRASHVDPNLAQVPKVKSKKVEDADGKKRTVILKGRDGDHGFECRDLFHVPEDFGWLIGADLEGIELRCFGELLGRYDNGAYLEVVLSRDIHEHNRQLAELDTRDKAKTFIYALLYGAGDIKIGSIVNPLATEDEQRILGAKLRTRFMANLPAFARVTRDVQGWARKGFLPGLDGRRLYVRSPHSALNTKLQSDAALLAKKWVLTIRDRLEDELGWRHGWDGDWCQLLWIHDEVQLALRHWSTSENRIDIITSVMKESAAMAGKHFGYQCPISAEAKVGHTWAQTH